MRSAILKDTRLRFPGPCHNGAVESGKRQSWSGNGMNIQFVRLDDEVCEAINRLAEKQQRTVSALVNQVLREFLDRHPQYSVEAKPESL